MGRDFLKNRWTNRWIDGRRSSLPQRVFEKLVFNPIQDRFVIPLNFNPKCRINLPVKAESRAKQHGHIDPWDLCQPPVQLNLVVDGMGGKDRDSAWVRNGHQRNKFLSINSRVAFSTLSSATSSRTQETASETPSSSMTDGENLNTVEIFVISA